MGNGTIREAHLSFSDKCIRVLARIVIPIVQRPKVCGPKPEIKEPLIFACRHVGRMDPVVLMVLYQKHIMRPLVARDYYDHNNFTRWFYRHAQCIPIDRHHTGATQWLEDSLAALDKGESVIIYPEGTRNKSGEGVMKFRRGVALLARKSGARVVPVYNGIWNFPGRYRLAIGSPMSLDPVPEEGVSAQWLDAQSEKMRQAVLDLAPLVENDKQ